LSSIPRYPFNTATLFVRWSGGIGIEQSSARLKRKASAASWTPAAAARVFIWSRCRFSMAVVSVSTWKVLLRRVLVALTFPDDVMAEAIVIWFLLQATADIGMPTSSPRRIPVTAPRTRSGAMSGVTSTAVDRRRESSSISGGVRSLERYVLVGI
jgi:hypothetical protein